MAWNTAYLMSLRARGRPFPTQSPEAALNQAVQQGSWMDVETTLQRGASPHARSPQGAGLIHAWLDAAQGRGQSMADPRVWVGVEQLARRHPGLLQDRHPRSGDTVAHRVARAAQAAPVLWLVRQPLLWRAPPNHAGQSVAEVLAAHAPLAELERWLPPTHALWEQPWPAGPTLRAAYTAQATRESSLDAAPQPSLRSRPKL